MLDKEAQQELHALMSPINVVKAARFILNLDRAAVQERYLLDIEAIIQGLEDSLQRFLQPTFHHEVNGFSPIERFESSLAILLEAVKNMLPCLTNDAQAALQRYLLNQEAAKLKIKDK